MTLTDSNPHSRFSIHKAPPKGAYSAIRGENYGEFDKYFEDTCSIINKKIIENYPHAAIEGVLNWAMTNEPELYHREEQAYALIDLVWPEESAPTAPFLLSQDSRGLGVGVKAESFKKTVLDWGRIVLKIYKMFSESPHGLLSKESSGAENQNNPTPALSPQPPLLP